MTCLWNTRETNPFVFSVGWFPAFLLSLLWAGLARARRLLPKKNHRATVATLCVGNLSSGGSGKTPVVAAVTAHFAKRRPAVISRGYRGKFEKAGSRVDPQTPEGAVQFGDEPWMLAHQTGRPVYVGADRAASVKKAEALDKPGLFIFDDGFQNRMVHYSKSILLWDPHAGPEAHYCLPLGTLREPLSALSRADFILLADKTGGGEVQNPLPVASAAKSFACDFESQGPFDAQGNPAHLNSPGRFGAFCGVGNPRPFFDTLKTKGLLAHEEPFPDHYWYTPSDIQRLNQVAQAKGLLGWVTTEKDWYRLGDARRLLGLPVYWTRLAAVLDPNFFRALENLEELT